MAPIREHHVDDRPDHLKVVDLGLTDLEVTDLDPTSSRLYFFWLGGRWLMPMTGWLVKMRFGNNSILV